MSRTSATQGKISEIRTRCKNKTCKRVLLIDGKIKCVRCGVEYTFAELYADLLREGLTTPEALGKEVLTVLNPFEDPPLHEHARWLFGDRFISTKEIVECRQMTSSFRFKQAYASYLSFPYSWEDLEQYAHADWWLIPGLPSMSKDEFNVFTIGPNVLHTDMLTRDMQEIYPSLYKPHLLPRWLLIRTRPTPSLLDIFQYVEFVRSFSASGEPRWSITRPAFAVEASYFFHLLRSIRGANARTIFSDADEGYWILEEDGDQPILFLKDGRMLFDVYSKNKYLYGKNNFLRTGIHHRVIEVIDLGARSR